MTTTFWLDNPNILLNKDYITEFWPIPNHSLESKLNAITRLIILLSILGYFVTHSIKIIITAVITLVALIVIYKTQKNRNIKKTIHEKFINPPSQQVFQADSAQEFTQPTRSNPLMNVVLPEIKYNPQRKEAAPSFNPKVEKSINENVAFLGGENTDIDPKLFVDLGDKLSFEHSMRQFHSTPNTKIPNDQTAFAKYCYGNMPSCKTGNEFQCLKNNARWINY